MPRDDAQTNSGRYAKQELFHGIGREGQARIGRGRVAVVGLGALGTVIAEQLTRAGVGHLRLIDRDYVEWANLQRQLLYTEEDARRRLPKAVAATAHLQAINSEVTVEGLVADLVPDEAEEALAGADVVLDGTDNLETRYLINDACVKAGVPWVYGAVLGAQGSSMTVVPGESACLRCLLPQAPPPGSMASCDTEGVLASVTGVIGSLEVAEALRLLVGCGRGGQLVCVDVWERSFESARVLRRDDCPACAQGRFEYLDGQRAAWTTVLCGRNSVQITPPEPARIALEALAQRLALVGRASYNGYLVTVELDERQITVFPNGRAIIGGTTDEAEARALYARYVGT